MSEMPPPSARERFSDGLPPIAIHAAIWAGVLILGLILGWIGRGLLAGPPDKLTITAFDDWRVICPSSKDKSPTCRMSQDVYDSKSGQTIASLVVLTQTEKDKEAKQVLAVNVPLNVLLEPGLRLKFGNELKSYQYKTCTEGGCIAIVPYDDKLESSFTGSTDAAVTVSRLDGKEVPLPFSTKGFAEARKALVSSDARLSSWWWRLWS